MDLKRLNLLLQPPLVLLPLSLPAAKTRRLVCQRTSAVTSQSRFVSSRFQRNNSIRITVNDLFWRIGTTRGAGLNIQSKQIWPFVFLVENLEGVIQFSQALVLANGSMLLISRRDLAHMPTVKSIKHVWLCGKSSNCDVPQARRFQPWLIPTSFLETAYMCVCDCRHYWIPRLNWTAIKESGWFRW